MRETRALMGMPITVDVRGPDASRAIDDVFAYFTAIDERFSTYKETSEITRINRGEIPEDQWSDDVREVFALAQQTKADTKGYFDMRRPGGLLDPSGIVKGWAIHQAALLLLARGYEHFYIDAGGDIAVHGMNPDELPWTVGIRNPFNQKEIVKIVYPRGAGVATSGSYVRGAHIYDPHAPEQPLTEVVSITVIGPDILEADRYATAVFAMGKDGITFLESVEGLEGYSIDTKGIATMTSGFEAFTRP